MKLLQNANQLSYKVLNKIFIKLETRIKLHKNFSEKKKKKNFFLEVAWRILEKKGKSITKDEINLWGIIILKLHHKDIC